MYRIERLGGRYRSVEEENTLPQRVHKLVLRDSVDLVAVLARYENRFSPVDTLYGSSVYEDMQQNIVYQGVPDTVGIAGAGD